MPVIYEEDIALVVRDSEVQLLEEVDDWDAQTYLNQKMNEAAGVLSIPLETLHAWYERQVAWWEMHHDRLNEAWKKASSPRQRLITEKRIRFARVFLKRLQTEKHILTCPDHGIQGITPEEVAEAITQPIDPALTNFEALALYGLFDGANTVSWTHICERCAEQRFKTEADEELNG